MSSSNIRVTSCIEGNDTLMIIEDRYLPIKRREEEDEPMINSVCSLKGETYVFLEKGQVYRLNRCGKDTKDKWWA
jgi:hypothetical protein